MGQMSHQCMIPVNKLHLAELPLRGCGSRVKLCSIEKLKNFLTICHDVQVPLTCGALKGCCVLLTKGLFWAVSTGLLCTLFPSPPVPSPLNLLSPQSHGMEASLQTLGCPDQTIDHMLCIIALESPSGAFTLALELLCRVNIHSRVKLLNCEVLARLSFQSMDSRLQLWNCEITNHQLK